MRAPSPEEFLPAPVRDHIERAYYARVNEQARLENLVRDPTFLEDLVNNPGLYSDHGVVHVRDVANQMLRVLQTINGLLIPRRPEQHMESFLYGYGVALAYLHDIGMCDLSPFGRAMHPEFAAQAIFDGSLDEIIDILWNEDCGGMAGHVRRLSQEGALRGEPGRIFRELLAMSMAHSKSKIPVAVLDDPASLRLKVQRALSHNLRHLYSLHQDEKRKPLPQGFVFDEEPPGYLSRFYTEFNKEAFDWLVDPSPAARQLTADVIDSVRALRCADAFRQRGTVEKTSGGYEIYASQQTGNGVVALRLGAGRLFLMEMSDNLDAAGESNIASSELTPEGDLRISFHRGAFGNPQARQLAVEAAAYVVGDVLRDTVASFWRAQPLPSIKPSSEILVLLESTDDDMYFTELVAQELRRVYPELAAQIQIAPSLRNVSDLERERYMAARELDWDLEKRRAIVDRLGRAGQKLGHLDLAAGFQHVKLAELHTGEKLIEAGTPSSFVYVPLGDGLRVIPLGGYQSISIAAWIPLGTTGVIRGDTRNADIIAEHDLSVLVIPKEIYLRYWYVPYGPAELTGILSGLVGSEE